MAIPGRLLALAVFLILFLSSPLLSSASNSLSQDSSLSVEKKDDVLTSPGETFVAGFFPVGDNAFYFAVWFNEPFCSANCTVVWMANRDKPVNGKRSQLALLKSGNLVLIDAGQDTVWATNTVSGSPVQLNLQSSGNLLLQKDGVTLWQSFDFPTNTLLPLQPLTRDWQLVSSRSESNYSSGFYKLYFDNDNVLRLLYDGPKTSSIYWPDPELLSWEAGRSSFNDTRIASFDLLGNFSSSDNFNFLSWDYGVILQRRLTIDSDGNLRLYSRKDGKESWIVTWQAMSQPCRVHGICGPNSVCNYNPSFGRSCSCLAGFKMKKVTDWSLGCEPEFNLSCSSNESTFLRLAHLEFYGYDFVFYPNYTLDMCENVCLQKCDCQGFQFKFIKHDYPSNLPYCFAKFQLLNGRVSPNFEGDLYLKVPKPNSSSLSVEKFSLECSGEVVTQLDKVYTQRHENGSLKFVLRFALVVGIIEFIGAFLVWCCLIRTNQDTDIVQAGYLQIAAGFRNFSYAELKKATRGYRDEIGRGAGGIVYKGVLSDHRVAGIKKLKINDSDHGEAEFRSEVSVIGKLNHMNLIEIWGYCAEGNHRLLVYEYMEHGSLAENLSSNKLDWKRRYDIALGTAKGLAYLHEECLEWVLHCDVKPQNILLDRNYQPKVSDFGLSHRLNRDSNEMSRLSRIRGTRGYIAPEWVYNLPITSKVDVYSYGMVLLEMVTGKSPATDIGDRGLVKWLREIISGCTTKEIWMQRIADINLEGKYDKNQMEILVEVALKCVDEDKDERPTMRRVVEMLTQERQGKSCPSTIH